MFLSATLQIYATDKPAEELEMGLYVVRGDTVAMVGDFDEAIDAQQPLQNIRGSQVKAVVHH